MRDQGTSTRRRLSEASLPADDCTWLTQSQTDKEVEKDETPESRTGKTRAAHRAGWLATATVAHLKRRRWDQPERQLRQREQQLQWELRQQQELQEQPQLLAAGCPQGVRADLIAWCFTLP